MSAVEKTKRSGERGKSVSSMPVFHTIIRLLLSGGSFNAPVSKRQSERSFCYRIDIPVPETGLGPRLNWMRGWCRSAFSPESWSMHSHHAATSRGRTHIVRFYFAHPAAADAFSQEWGTACVAEREAPLPSIIAKTQAALSACLGAQSQELYAF